MLGSRRAGEPWFCIEQPARDATAHAGLGRRARAGGRRSATVQGARAPLARAQRAGAVTMRRTRRPGSGWSRWPGFAFADDGAGSPAWRGFGAASLTVPGGLARASRRAHMDHVQLAVTPDDDAELLLERLEQRLSRAATSVRCRCSIPRRSGSSRCTARCRRRTTRRRSRALSSGSEPASSRRSCSPARCRCAPRRPTTRARCSTCSAAAFRSASSTPSAAARRPSSARRPELLVRRDGHAREHRRAGGLDAPQRRPGGRRPPRREPAAQRQEPAREPRRRRADRQGAGAVTRSG